MYSFEKMEERENSRTLSSYNEMNIEKSSFKEEETNASPALMPNYR